MLLALCVFFTPPAGAGIWLFALQQGQMDIALPDYQSGGWQASGMRARIVNSVRASNQQVKVTFKPGSRLTIARLSPLNETLAVELHNIELNLADTSLTIDTDGPGSLPERTRIAGNLNVDIGELHHPRLQPQRWWFQGYVTGTLADLTLQGQLESGSGLSAAVSLNNRTEPLFTAAITMTMAAQKVGAALAETLKDWPELLSLESGELVLQANLGLRPGASPVLNARLDIARASGVMDRTAITNLSGSVLVSLDKAQLSAGLRDLRIDEINSGIGIGPVQLLADYQANTASLLAGQLTLQQATADFLGGRLRLASRTFDLSERPWRVPVEVQELALERLLQVYPAEGFAGTGKLSGRIPVMLTTEGVEVNQGSLQAMSPGGTLIMPAERLQAMLGSSEAMELVVQALQNFHYSVLKSTIDYDEQGKLVLGLRLEGENPDLRGGQPFVVNINLEEDIPALLTSLQLSGRVNDAVTERVRERLNQSGQEAVP